MAKITVDDLKKIVNKYSLKIVKVKNTEMVNIIKNPSEKYVEIGWPEFEEILKSKKLAIYKATESDFLKIMKEK